MSTIAMAWAMREHLPALSKMLLITLADHHNAETGQCNPSIRRICAVSGMTARTVNAHTKALTTLGHITVTPASRYDGSQTSNDYHLAIPEAPTYTSLITPHVSRRERESPEPTPIAGPTEPTEQTPVAATPAADAPRIGDDPPATDAYHEQLPGIPSNPGIQVTKETSVTNVTSSKKKPEVPTGITEEFRARMGERFGPVFGNTLDERIEEALNHTSVKKYNDLELYVQAWLRRDAERNGKRASSPTPPTPPPSPPSGWAENGRLLSRKERREMNDANSS